MEPMKKPEWFELTESERRNPRITVKRRARGAILALPILLIGMGAVVAQSADESPANAETATVAVASAAPTVSQPMTKSSAPSVNSVAAPAKPSIATPPTGGGDDDENDDEGDDD